MKETMIFKTDISHVCFSHGIGKLLNDHALVEKWSVDLEDCDRVLCVDSEVLSENDVIFLLQTSGHHCQILD